MRRKKGFTLIELLAVIVVLAIILVLSIPKILEIIENAEKQAYKESAELMAHTAQIQYQTKEVDGTAKKIPDEGITYYYYNNKQVKSFEDSEKEIEITKTDDNYLDFKGDKPFSGTITLTKDKKVIISDLISKNKKWCVKKEVNEKSARVGRRTNPDFNCTIEGEDEVVVDDKDPCSLEIDEETGVYYVDSPSDLYALSQSVKSGNKYSGKTIKVRNDLDMSDVSNTCGQNSFFPIGTSSNPFGGTFDGGAKTISNLEVIANENFSNQVGLFGVVGGTSDAYANIYGVVLQSPTTSGNQYVGTLAGMVNTYVNIYEIELNDIDVTGTDYVGGLVGYYFWFPENINNILLKSGTINASTTGGLMNGAANYRYTSSIVENATLTAPTVYLTAADYNSYHSNNVIVNSAQVTNGFDSDAIDDINFYEAIGFDTWIGGDNTYIKGYYFDYDSNKVVLKSVEKNPFPNESKILTNGSGTKDDPYLIKNESDWKKIVAYPNNSDMFVKLDSNLDFSNNKFYMFGSEKNVYTGNFIGNDKTISNVTIKGLGNCKGIFGYAHGAIIYGLNLDNISISGSKHLGIIGMLGGNDGNYGNVYAIRINNLNLSGTENVGGLIGYVGSYIKVYEIELNDVNVIGNSCIGGAVGYYFWFPENIHNILFKSGTINASATGGLINGASNSRYTNSIVENATLTAPTAYLTAVDYKSYHSNNVIVNDTKVTNGFDPKAIDDINFYSSIGMDTWIGSDNDISGYYFDYDSNKVVLKSVKKYPFPNVSKILTNGSGTKDDPYLIKNESDWKKIAAYPNNSNMFVKLDSNLDFSNNKFYMLGSEQGVFTGTFIGNDKTISNVTIKGLGNCKGIFGYAHGAIIYGLNLDNISISGTNNVGIIGMLGGNNDKYGNVYAIRLNNLDLMGSTYVAGLIGYVGSYIKVYEIELNNVDVIGNSCIGGAVGYYFWFPENIHNILFKSGTINASTSGGLINGAANYRYTSSIVENATLTAPTAYLTTADYNSYHSSNVMVNGTNVTNGFDVSNIDNIYYYKGVLETLFKGDANGTGYFFDVADDGKIHLVKAYTLTPPTNEETGENIGPSTGVCSIYPCTCECGCICNDGSDGATQTRCESGCGLN